MRMSSTVESALHTCAVLAAVPEGGTLPVQRLAEFHDLAPASLAKQLQALTAAGLVDGSTGRTGGYRLARAPGQITILDIVTAIDGPEPAFRCREIRRVGPCTGPDRDYSPTCAIAAVMGRAEEAWRESLRRSTLADVGSAIVAELDPRTARETAAWIATNQRSSR